VITIIDSIMGSGKTSLIVEHINHTYRDYLGQCVDDHSVLAPKFLYVTPLLTEVDRINEACPGLNFRDPQPVEGKKLYHLSSLIEQGANICTTHALFQNLTKNICEKLKAQNYTLVIDEALECVKIFDDLSKSDKDLLFRDGLVFVEEGTNRLKWNHKDDSAYQGKFSHIRDLCDNGNLVQYRDKALIWEFPTDFLRCFEEAFILTYMFLGSPMSAYLRAEGLDHDIMTINDKRKLVPWDEASDDDVTKEKLKGLITVYEGPGNRWGEAKGKSKPFSKSWFQRRSQRDLAGIKATTQHWFKMSAQTLSHHNAWTTFKDVKKDLSGDRYARGFIPCNAKATNDHIEKRSLAYLCNVYYNPFIKGYFQDRGIEVHEDLFALSEMVQWIWRSQIRRSDPITVFIPSERMRSLFVQWLHSASSGDRIECEFKQTTRVFQDEGILAHTEIAMRYQGSPILSLRSTVGEATHLIIRDKNHDDISVTRYTDAPPERPFPP